MAGTKVADFFAEIGFVVKGDPVKQLQAKAKALSQEINNTAKSFAKAQKGQAAGFKEHIAKERKLSATIKDQTKAKIDGDTLHNGHVVHFQKQRQKAEAQELKDIKARAQAELKAIEKKETIARRAADSTLAHDRRIANKKLSHSLATEKAATRQKYKLQLASARRSSSLSQFASQAGGHIGGALAPVAAGASLAGVGRGVFDAGNFQTGMRSAFEALTGSEQGASAQMEFLNSEVKRLKLNLLDAGQSYKQLFASAKSRIGAEETQKLFSALSETTVVFGLTADQEARAIRAISQIASKGQAMSEEVVGQWAEAIPGGVEMFAKAAKMSTEDFREAMKDGKILAKDILPELTRVLQSNVSAEALEKALQSPLRSYETFSTKLFEMFDEIGKEGGYEALKALFNSLGEAADWVKGHLEAIKSVANGIATVVGAAWNIFKTAISGLSGLIGEDLTGALLVAGAAALYFGAPFVGIALAISGVVLIVNELIKVMQGADSVLYKWASGGGILATVAFAFAFIGETIGALGETLGAVAASLVALFSGDFAGAAGVWSDWSADLDKRDNRLQQAWYGEELKGGKAAIGADGQVISSESYHMVKSLLDPLNQRGQAFPSALAAPQQPLQVDVKVSADQAGIHAYVWKTSNDAMNYAVTKDKSSLAGGR